MKVISILYFAFTMAALAQTNYTAVSNLGQPAGGTSAYVNTTIARADSFTTGNTPADLSSVSILIFGYFNGGSPGPFTLALYNDNAGSPGSPLAVLSGENYPTNTGFLIYTYTCTNSSPVMLSAGTTYWVVASSPDTAQGDYILPLTTTNALDPGSVWTMGMLKDYEGGSWYLSGNYFEFSVAVAPQPPAMTISLEPQTTSAVLTYPTPDFSFRLQQNSDLATTNWNDVTDASIVTNQQTTLVTVPVSGPTMFFRLNPQ